MLKIVSKREMLQEETLQGPTVIVASTTIGHMKGEMIEEGMKEEETPDDRDDSYRPPKRPRNSRIEEEFDFNICLGR